MVTLVWVRFRRPNELGRTVEIQRRGKAAQLTTVHTLAMVLNNLATDVIHNISLWTDSKHDGNGVVVEVKWLERVGDAEWESLMMRINDMVEVGEQILALRKKWGLSI